MPLSGIRLIRQTFADFLPKGWTVAQAFLSYKNDDNRQYQVLTFHVTDPAGKDHLVTSETVPAHDDVSDLTIRTAKTFVEGIKNEPPATGARTDD